MTCATKRHAQTAARTAAALLLSLAFVGSTAAQNPATPRVSGPITITADNGEWLDGNMVYTGNVVMISRTLELRGARLEMQQSGGKKNPYTITMSGNPATLKHKSETPLEPVVDGRSKTMIYRSATQDVQLTGDAHLERNKDELNGEDIRYDIANRRVQASGGSKGQVRIVIDVPEEQ